MQRKRFIQKIYFLGIKMRITKIKLLDEIVISLIKVYNHRLYWYMRKQVVNNNGFILSYIFKVYG